MTAPPGLGDWDAARDRVTWQNQAVREATATERERIAAVLRRAAAGRREYAGPASDTDNEFATEVRTRMLMAAACCESAAELITDPLMIMDVIPAWRWTDEERASLGARP